MEADAAAQYESEITADIAQCIDHMGCQPILFVGSGISKRYFQGPSWSELLEAMAKLCPEVKKDFAYYLQTYDDLIDIGQELANCFKEWAWGSKKEFPKELFLSRNPQVYLKHKVCEFFRELTPTTLSSIKKKDFREEIQSLINIRPHAIITTNYDRFLELVYPEYVPVVGQQILRTSFATVGEIFKIHGCVSDAESIVLTRTDYTDFQRKKKYLSAKLLTYFAEHPLLFVGYRAEDPNIKAILSDIDEILSGDGELIPNIYLVSRVRDPAGMGMPARERVIAVDHDRTVRIKSISAHRLQWVFDAFSAQHEIEKVSPKVLRAFLSRTYEMVRHDIPRKTVEVDYSTLEHVVADKGELPKLLGISTLDNPATFNAHYPYTITGLSKKLGFAHWNGAHRLLMRIKADKGIDVKESDNKYHVQVKTGDGPTSRMHKYSDAAVDLLTSVRDGKTYDVKLPAVVNPA